MPKENYYNEYEENQYMEGQIPRKSNIDDQFAKAAKEYGKNDPKYDSKATKVSTDNNYLFHKISKKFTSLDELQKYQKEEMREEINDIVYKPDKDSFNDDHKVVDSKLDSVPGKKYTYNVPKLFAGPPRTIPVSPRTIHVSIDDIISGNRDSRNSRLSWLFDISGLVYRFDRGMILINQDGLKDDDEVDPTDSFDHHFNSIERLARRTFGIQLVTTDTIARCVEATEQGLVAMMCEGAKCYIFLPDEITEAQIDQIISEVEPRDFTFTLAKDADRFSDQLTREEVLAYFGSLKREFRVNNPDNAEEEVLSDREAYINELLIYIYQNGMSLNQYFTMLGEKLKNGDVTGLPDFERINPFLNPDDIRRLYDAKEDRIVEYFAHTMTGVIALNLGELGQLQENKEEKEPEHKEDENLERNVRIAYINSLMQYVKENGISTEDYYRSLGNKLRNNDLNSIPQFEENNPFLSEESIEKLIDSDDERIVDYFANTMARVIDLNLNEMNNNKQDTSNQKNREQIMEEAREAYINSLMQYVKENGISTEEYYRSLGNKLRNNDLNSIPQFEVINPFLSEESLNKLLDSDDERIVDYFAHTMAKVIDLNLNEMNNNKQDDKLNKEDTSNQKNREQIMEEAREAYINSLMQYVKENEISTEDYYRSLGNKLRNNDLNSIPQFEVINPFLSEESLNKLLDSDDERIVDYFAHTMAKVIDLNLNEMNNNKQDDKNTNSRKPSPNIDKFKFGNISKENDISPNNLADDELDLDEMSYLDDKTNYMSGIKITYINTDLIEKMSGLAVIKESKTGRINIYGYKNDDVNLSGKKVIDNSNSKVESGYYVNLSEYVGILAHGIEDQYGKNTTFAFVSESGEYLDFYEVINKIMAACRNEGALRYGREYKDTNIGSYEDLEKQYDGRRGLFKGIELTKGLYVRRDILIEELKKYRVAVTKENIDNISRAR